MPPQENERGTRPVGAEWAAGNEVLQLLHGLRLLGLEEERLCEVAGLDPSQLREPGGRIERGFFPALFQAAELLSGDRLVGLHAAEAWGARSLLGHLTESEETVGKALREIARFAPVAVDTLRIEIDEGPVSTWIRADLGAAATPHGREYLTALMVLHIREAADSEIRVSEIRFPHAARGAIAEYGRVLQAPVRFRQPEWAIALPSQALRTRLATANQEVARALRMEVRQQLEASSSESFRTRVENALRRAFADGNECGPERIARRLAVSVRTLQRRLTDEGTSLREVRDGVRQELARALLADRSLRISDVADRLGFTDVAAFDNAFKRWTSETPTSFRRHL